MRRSERLGVRSEKLEVSCKLSVFSFGLAAFRLFLTAFVLFLSNFCFSQSVSATLDRDKILLGEQITLEVKADDINPQTKPVINWFSIPDTINHIEVVKRSPIDTIAVNGTMSYVQDIVITSFDSGNWQLPHLLVTLQSSDTKKDTLRTNNLTIQVLPVDISNLQQYHDMKDIIDVEVKPNYWLIAGMVVLVLLAGIGIWFLFFRKKKKKPVIQPVAARSLFETAIEQLEALQKANPPSPQFYIKLDEICRTYFQNQLYIRALQLTSDELMIQLNVYIQLETRSSFYQLLRLISTVKFAKYQPGEERKTGDIDTAKAAIQHIYFQLQRSLSQHAK